MTGRARRAMLRQDRIQRENLTRQRTTAPTGDRLTEIYSKLNPGVGSFAHALEQLDAELARNALEQATGQNVDTSASDGLESPQERARANERRNVITS